jgi:hypothetical protein
VCCFGIWFCASASIDRPRRTVAHTRFSTPTLHPLPHTQAPAPSAPHRCGARSPRAAAHGGGGQGRRGGRG